MINHLSWDSLFFGVSIYELKHEDVDKANLDREVNNLDSGDLIQCKTNIENLKSIEKLTKYGFSIEDSGVTYEMAVDSKTLKHGHFRVELAVEQDRKVIQQIAQDAFFGTRFKDSYYGEDSANKIYKYWVSAAIKGTHDDCCLIKKNKDGLIVGFVTVKKVDNYIKIGLIAVDNNYQRKGIAKELMEFVEVYAVQNHVDLIMVTTQCNNNSAKRLYRSMGYSEFSEFFWLYFKV
jgi:dTDP-4-amino-4,6-dideoxy-D-galactose acyltransferase